MQVIYWLSRLSFLGGPSGLLGGPEGAFGPYRSPWGALGAPCGSWLGPWGVLFGGPLVPLLLLKRGRHLGKLGPVRLNPVAVLGGFGCLVWVPSRVPCGVLWGVAGLFGFLSGWLYVSHGLTDIN